MMRLSILTFLAWIVAVFVSLGSGIRQFGCVGDWTQRPRHNLTGHASLSD